MFHFPQLLTRRHRVNTERNRHLQIIITLSLYRTLILAVTLKLASSYYVFQIPWGPVFNVYGSMTGTLNFDFLLRDHIYGYRRLSWNVRCENLKPIGTNLKKLPPKNRASWGLKSIVGTPFLIANRHLFSSDRQIALVSSAGIPLRQRSPHIDIVYL